MVKRASIFVCGNCGHEEIRWLGQCPACGEWNSLTELRMPKATGNKAPSQGPWRGVGDGRGAAPVPLADISAAVAERLTVRPEEMARVLGGGLVSGSVVLLGGEPGVGKSTLLTGLALDWTANGVRVLYVSGEESPAQIRLRAERLGFDRTTGHGFHIIDQTHLESLLDSLYLDAQQHTGPCVVIVDSVQTLHSDQIDAHPGSVGQIRYGGGALADYARQTRRPIFLVGHVTKTGDLAGPKVLEHMVDTVLYFEGSGGASIRMVRAVKNRFGATGELAIMEMRGDGLVPVDEAGALFLSGRRGDPGSCICAVRNGSRVFLVEVQALVSPSRYGTPQRVVQGVDSKRVALLAAILEKRAGLDLSGCDIFVKVTGGAKLEDPGADLALMTALASSLREIAVPADMLILGEVGLTGMVRDVTDRTARLKEAARHGFKRVVLATTDKKARSSAGVKIHAVTTVGEAVDAALIRDFPAKGGVA